MKTNKQSKRVREDKARFLLPIFIRVMQNPDLLKLPHGLTAIEIYALKEIGLWPIPTPKRKGLKKKK